MLSYFIAIFFTVTVGLVSSSPSGAPCFSANSLKPGGPHPDSQNDVAPSPYDLLVYKASDTSKIPVTSYKPCETYVVVIKGTYQGFLLQARGLNADGAPDPKKKVGNFLDDGSWVSQGIRYQGPCPGTPEKVSVTHTNNFPKTDLQVQWKPTRASGHIQFVMTVAQSQDVYWDNIAPAAGNLELEPESKKDKC